MRKEDMENLIFTWHTEVIRTKKDGKWGKLFTGSSKGKRSSVETASNLLNKVVWIVDRTGTNRGGKGLKLLRATKERELWRSMIAKKEVKEEEMTREKGMRELKEDGTRKQNKKEWREKTGKILEAEKRVIIKRFERKI